MRKAPDLETRDLHYSYSDSIHALHGVSLRLPPGSFTALIGQNGSGKSTLARQLNGLQRPTRGKVLLDGEDVGGRSAAELASTVGYCFQNPDHQIFSPSTRQEVAFGPANLGLEPERVARRVDEELRRFGLEGVANRAPATLSYGQRRLVSLAAIFAMRTPILVLDEPTLGLDNRHIGILMEALEERHARGASILLISHDMNLIAARVPRTALLHQGELLAAGPTEQVLGDQDVMTRSGLERPPVIEVLQRLRAAGHELPFAATPEALCRLITQRLGADR